MEFDPFWYLLGLPLAFALGWLAARSDLRLWRDQNQRTPSAYARGLTLLLNEKQEEAIEAFIETIQRDHNDIELHFALGHLFRSRAEFQQAIHIHKNLLARGDLSAADRDRTRYALAQDYLKTGLLDHSKEALLQLEGTRFAHQAHWAMLSVYERLNDWEQASALAQRMQNDGQSDFSVRQAHYLCEQADKKISDIEKNTATINEEEKQREIATAIALLTQAIHIAPHAARARLTLAQLHQNIDNTAAALHTLLEVIQFSPIALPLVAPLLVIAVQHTGYDSSKILDLLHEHQQRAPSLDVLNAIVALQGGPDAHQHYLNYLENEPSLVAVVHWLKHTRQSAPHNPLLPTSILDTLERAAAPLMLYRCASCGSPSHRHRWRCISCFEWDSYPPHRVEEL